jgi:hypothetical protein
MIKTIAEKVRISVGSYHAILSKNLQDEQQLSTHYTKTADRELTQQPHEDQW